MHSLHKNSYSSVLSICETIVLYLECCFFALMYSLSKNLQRRLKTSRHNQLTELTQQLRRQLVWIPTCWGPNCFQVNQFYLMIVHSQSQKTVLIWENVFLCVIMTMISSGWNRLSLKTIWPTTHCLRGMKWPAVVKIEWLFWQRRTELWVRGTLSINHCNNLTLQQSVLKQ